MVCPIPISCLGLDFFSSHLQVDKVGTEKDPAGIDDCLVLDLGGDLGIVWQRLVGYSGF